MSHLSAQLIQCGAHQYKMVFEEAIPSNQMGEYWQILAKLQKKEGVMDVRHIVPVKNGGLIIKFHAWLVNEARARIFSWISRELCLLKKIKGQPLAGLLLDGRNIDLFGQP